MKKTKLLALLLALTVLCLVFAGCAAGTAAYDSAAQNTKSAPSEPMAPMETPAEEPAQAPVTEESSDVSFMTTDASAPDAPAGGDPQMAADYAAKIIYRANIYLQTTEFDQTAAAIETMTSSFGGFVESSNVSGDIDYRDDGTTRVINRYGYYTLRVPCGRFEEFLSQAKGLGNVLQQSKNAENVTSQYTDYEARLSSLRTQEERLLAMLEKSEDVETLIAIESRLADVRYETEAIERSLRNLDMQISYSTVDLTVQEVEVYTPTAPVQRTFGQKLSDSFSSGWRSFARGLQRFVLGLAEAVPALILLAAAAVAVVIVVRRVIKKRRAGKAEDAPPKDGSAE